MKKEEVKPEAKEEEKPAKKAEKCDKEKKSLCKGSGGMQLGGTKMKLKNQKVLINLKKTLNKKRAALLIIREKLALDLSNEIYMAKDEAYELVDFSLQLTDKIPETYDQLKSEIKAYIIINMLSLVTKFQ